MDKIAPGPAPLKILWQFYAQNQLEMFRQAAQQYGDLVRFEAAGYTLYQITHPAHIEHVISQGQYELSVNFEKALPVVGRGLATNSGESWKQQRRLIQPAFNHQHLTPFAKQMTHATTRLLDRWAANQQQVIDIAPDLVRLNHQMLGLAVLSLDFEQRPDLLEALKTVRRYLTARFQAMMAVPEALPTPRNLRFRKAAQQLDTFVYHEISQRREQGSTKHDFLHLFLHAEDAKTGARMDDTQLHDELNTLLFNGYEDVGGSLAWTLYLLAQHPDSAAQLQAEVDQVLGGRVPTMDDLPDMPYNRMVITESLRLYPPTWAIMRDALADDEIGGYPIKKGASVMINLFLTHRHPEFWRQPEVFQPERFADDRAARGHRFDYLPFGAGARQCVGRNLALMQLQLVLPMLVQRFRYTLAPDQKIEIDASSSLRPKHGIRMRVEAK